MAEDTNRILITGALGYVGGRVATYLAKSASHLELRLMTSRADAVLPEDCGTLVVLGRMAVAAEKDAELIVAGASR